MQEQPDITPAELQGRLAAEKAVATDAMIRDMPEHERAGLRKGGKLYLHRSLIPLEDAAIDNPDQLDLWHGECEGMCGV